MCQHCNTQEVDFIIIFPVYPENACQEGFVFIALLASHGSEIFFITQNFSGFFVVLGLREVPLAVLCNCVIV